jgi:N-acyl-L-homoserine lactone synthetase
MMSERGVFLEATRDFDVTIADTPAALEAAYRLRHQVYCVERGYEPGQGTIETDRFDPRAGHVLLTQRSTGRVVGTVRVVAPALDGLTADLPMQRLCASDAFRPLPRASTGEISRFSISKDLRDAACAGSMPLRLGLLQGVLRVSVDMGLTHWCAIMEHRLLRLLRVSAIHFQPLGPAIEHRGLRQPSWAGIDALLARIKRERPALWDYFTEGGSLWQDEVQREKVESAAFA